ncbi:hypothetical protein [Streptomyces mirabilis]|uniref:hypothetical protein n=1 Tax=Streptomyces mirabilis TaxID=68239 RepID=UPI00332418EB
MPCLQLRMSIARIAAGLGVSWNTVDDAVPATGHHLLIADPTRFAESTRQNTEPARR